MNTPIKPRCEGKFCEREQEYVVSFKTTNGTEWRVCAVCALHADDIGEVTRARRL
jgi:hypothetical protein